MIGAVIGDIAGSRFEWDTIKTKDFEFFSDRCFFTDDSVMSLAVARAVLESGGDTSLLGAAAIRCMRQLGLAYPDSGYGGMFAQWLMTDNPCPYNSFGNGAAMRVSACGFAAASLEQAVEFSKRVTEVTHNHPEGIKGAEAAAVCVYLAKTGKTIPEIRDYVNTHYYPMNFTLDGIRDDYFFLVTCQDTVPQAIMSFLESTSFEDAVRNAISLGGDSDTLAAITGGIAEAYYGVPANMRAKAQSYLPQPLLRILLDFEKKFPPKVG